MMKNKNIECIDEKKNIRRVKRNALYFPRIFLSGLATLLFNFSTGIFLLETTKVGIPFAVNIMIFNLPFIFITPFFARFCNKVKKKKMIIWSSLLNFIVMGVIYISWEKTGKMPLIFLGTLILSISTGVAYLVFETGLPELFEEKDLGKANSMAQIMGCMGKILGPLLSGILYSIISMRTFVGVITGILAIIVFIDLILHMDSNRDKTQNSNFTEEVNFNLTSSRKALRYCLTNIELRDILVGFIIVNIVVLLIVSVPIPFILKNDLQVESKILGLIFTMGHVGGIAGALFTLKRSMKLEPQTFRKLFSAYLLVSLIFISPLIKGADIKTFIYIYIVGMFFSGMTWGVLDIVTSLYFQKNIGKENRGALVGILTSVSRFIGALAALVSGKMVDLLSPRSSMGMGIALLLLSILYYYLLREREENKKFVVAVE